MKTTLNYFSFEQKKLWQVTFAFDIQKSQLDTKPKLFQNFVSDRINQQIKKFQVILKIITLNMLKESKINDFSKQKQCLHIKILKKH